MFRGAFSAPFANPFGPISWYLSGDIPAANCIAAYQPKGAASLALSYINLANPGTYNAAPGTAPTWDAVNGWMFVATSSQYLDTGIINQGGWSAIVRYSNVSPIAGVLIGSYTAVNVRFAIVPNNTDDKVYYQNGSFLGVAPGLSGGVLAIAGQQGYRNGIADGGAIGNWSGTNVYSIHIGNSLNALYISAFIQSLSIYNITLAASQVLAVTLAMQSL